MRTEFRTNRRSARLSATIGAVFGVLFLLLALLDLGTGVRIFCAVLAAIGFAAFGLGLRAYRDRRILLAVGPDGLFYRRFSDKPVPWSEITAFAVVRRMQRLGLFNRRDYAHQHRLDTLNFAVAEPSQYRPRGVLRTLNRLAGVPPIEIPLYFVDATTAEVVAAVKRFWNGDIAEIELRSR